MATIQVEFFKLRYSKVQKKGGSKVIQNFKGTPMWKPQKQHYA